MSHLSATTTEGADAVWPDVEPPEVIAVFGGVYNNYLALDAVLADARARGATRFICLGDMGGFGPHPDRVFPLLKSFDVACVQGNYDHSVGHALDDCACGYTDERDNHYARISYAYTLENTSTEHRAWLRTLPPRARARVYGRRALFAHGSPRRTNEFLWESQCSDVFLATLLDAADAEILLVTHTGLPWARELPDGRVVLNVGAIGRPPNHGRTDVVYVMISPPSTERPEGYAFHYVDYDYERLAREMRAERLPEAFVETIETGWWTTCLEVLPAKERHAGAH